MKKWNWGQRMLALIYTGMVFCIYYYTENYLMLGGFGFMYYYLFGIGIVVLAFLSFLVKPKVLEGVLLIKHCFIVMLPYLVSIFFSCILWVSELAEFNVITRGFFMPVYSMIGIAVATVTVYMFGERGIYLHLVGLVAANVVKLVGQVRFYGLSAVLEDYIQLVITQGGNTGTIAKEFENYGYAYAFMIFLMYFVLFPGKKRWRWLLVPVCLVGFLIGYKRSALFGMLGGIAAGLLFRIVSKNRKLGFFTGVCILLVAVGQGLVVAIRNGLYHWITDVLHVDTMGRVTMYDAIEPYYELNLGFLGRGLGFVNQMLTSGEIKVRLGVGYLIRDIHNEFLRMYIEIGQIGFLAWLWVLLVTRMRYFIKTQNEKQAVMAFSCLIFWFITFLSENILYWYYAVMPLSLITIGCGFDGYVKEKKQGLGQEKAPEYQAVLQRGGNDAK